MVLIIGHTGAIGAFEEAHVLVRYAGSMHHDYLQLPFEITGRGGVDLNDKLTPHPTTYLSMCVDGFPNIFMSLPSNSIISAGILLPILETALARAV